MPRYISRISNPNAGLSCLDPDFDPDWNEEEMKEEQEAEAADYYEERNGV